ncbi:MAG: hypothetical protein Fur0028_08690 [Bacteroidales bacterium]
MNLYKRIQDIKPHIKGLQGEKWDILPNRFLTTESLSKLQKGKEELHELAKEFFKRPKVLEVLNTRFANVKVK